jgi:hypothetical protein
VAKRRGTAGDVNSFLLGQSLLPQLEASVTSPCAGGLFYRDRLMACLVGIENNKAVCEIGVSSGPVMMDAADVAGAAKGAWCAMPAPHVLAITDAYYGDEDEWSDAVTGAYRALMRSMRDAGIGGHVLICTRADEAEVASVARRKVFFFLPDALREDLAVLLGAQHEIAAPPAQLGILFGLLEEYDLRRLVLVNPDREAIALSLTYLDPDQITIGGYCTGTCDEYWKNLVKSAYYTG